MSGLGEQYGGSPEGELSQGDCLWEARRGAERALVSGLLVAAMSVAQAALSVAEALASELKAGTVSVRRAL